MSEFKVHKNIIVTGDVQGVGFRFACKNIATAMGIKGFVKNKYEGTVYIEAEGTELQIFHFIEWCKKGPSHAYVTDINVSKGDLKNFNHFEIIH